MPAPDIAALIENFPPQNPGERAALLDFARTTPLNYGNWKHFKKLFKLAEASALSSGEVDIELLGILLGRIDAATIPQPTPQLKLLPDTPAMQGATSVKSADAEYSVSGRKQWDYSGFRVQVRVLKQGKTGILRRALEIVHATTHESTATRVYDFDARQWIGYEHKLSLKGDILEVEARNYNNRKPFRFNVGDPEFIYLDEGRPQPATWQYMKRRARRLLRKLSTQRPETYLELLAAALREMKKSTLDPALNWAAMDALFSSNQRWRQVAHGRGPYQIAQPRFILKTREENAPRIWDANLVAARALLADENVLIQANLTALKVLRANRQSLPEISDALLQKFLMQDEPVLQSFATRQIAARVSQNASTPPAIAGAALMLAGAPARRLLQPALEAALRSESTPASWKSELANVLSRMLGVQKTARRRNIAAHFLGTHLQSHIADDVLFANLQLFLEQSQESTWILERVAARGKSGELKFLDDIARLSDTFRDLVLAAFAGGAKNSSPVAGDALALVTKTDEAQNRVGWQFLAATQIGKTVTRELWSRLTQTYYDDAVYRAAMSEAALPLWRRADYSIDEMRQFLNQYVVWMRVSRLAAWEFLQEVLSPLGINEQLAKIFPALSTLPPETAAHAVEFYSAAAREYSPSSTELHSWMTWPSEAQWQLLASSAVSAETLCTLGPVFFRVNHTMHAALVFRRANFESDTVAAWLSKNPTHRESFSPEFFLAVLDALSGEAKIGFILEVSEAQWQTAREPFLKILQSDGAAGASFWDGALGVLARDSSLASRITGDEEIAATFLKITPGGFAPLLQKHGASQATLLLRWLETHADELPQGDEVLIAAATHEADAIRLWGLRRVRVLGLNVAVSLRLMESGLPQPFALGREYFESAARDTNDEQEHALALCDSPNAAVQNYGREFISRRASTLLRGDTLQKLTEHFEPQMQAWVAGQLQNFPDVDAREFDRTLLKTKGRARLAKEKVKTRLASTSSADVDASVLIEMARGSLARDREWALQQLASRALAGEEISGVVLEK
jgi:hypothetical protein